MNKLVSITFLSLFLTACSILNPYKADIHQGSVLNRSTIEQLKIGMSKSQVHTIIGTPSIVDPFHNNQWDYINYTALGSGKVVHYRLMLTFKEGKLDNINTDDISSLPKMTDKEKAEKEVRLAKEKADKEAARLAKEKAEKEKAEKEAQLAKEKAEKAKIEKAKKEAAEKARLAKEKAEKARLAKEKVEKEKAEKDALIIKKKTGE